MYHFFKHIISDGLSYSLTVYLMHRCLRVNMILFIEICFFLNNFLSYTSTCLIHSQVGWDNEERKTGFWVLEECHLVWRSSSHSKEEGLCHQKPRIPLSALEYPSQVLPWTCISGSRSWGTLSCLLIVSWSDTRLPQASGANSQGVHDESTGREIRPNLKCQMAFSDHVSTNLRA